MSQGPYELDEIDDSRITAADRLHADFLIGMVEIAHDNPALLRYYAAGLAAAAERAQQRHIQKRRANMEKLKSAYRRSDEMKQIREVGM